MTTPTQDRGSDRALLDTTVLLDRIKSGARRSRICEILSRFGWQFATSISVLELKATVVQQCILMHNQLRKIQRFTAARDALLEKDHPQAKLRGHIFNNLVRVYGSSHDVTDAEDRLLAEQARLNLENIIPELFHEFSRAVDLILRKKINCTRALEPPHKKRVAFETSLPVCQRGKNKTCTVENAIRESGPDLLARLAPFVEEGNQFDKTRKVIQKVLQDLGCDLSHGDCRNAGDCLIFLEGHDSSTHAVSSNEREWAPLSAIMGLEFVHITYPEEKTL